MSYCPRPEVIVKNGARATFTANPPDQRTEACNASTTVITTSGNNTSTTIYVQGPPGPQGERGPEGWGFKWEGNYDGTGEWAEGEVYVAQSDEHPRASVVRHHDMTFVCIQDHISEATNEPFGPDETTVGEGAAYWELFTNKGADGKVQGKEKTFLEALMDGVFDWMKNATLEDWLEAAAIAAGVIWAGDKILDMMSDDGEGNADSRFNGSAGYNGAYTPPGLRTVVSGMCDYAGILYDASALPEDPCAFTVGAQTGIRTILDQLSLAYQFDMCPSGGVLKFVPRSGTAVKTITLDDMGYSNSDVPPAPYQAKRFQGIDLPRQVSLTYFTEDIDYNQYTQTAELYTYTEGQNVSLTVPVTLEHQKAKEICEVALVNAHLERMNYKFNTSYKFVDVEPGDVLDSPMGMIRVTKITEVDEGVLEFEACDAGGQNAITGSTMAAQPPTTSNNVAATIGFSQGLWIDPNALNDHDTGIRMYAAIHGYGKAGWPGAAVYVSEDNGASYTQLASTYVEASVGIVTVPMPSVDHHGWDRTSSVVVQLKTGELKSVPELAVLNGQNWAIIGQEIIGFANATLIGDKTYRLTNLLRGRRGTEVFVGTHTSNELFALLDTLIRLDFKDADRNTTKKFKVVTIGSSLDKVDGEDVKIVSNNTRMWAVCNAKAVKTGSDWVISWKERVRFDNQLKDFSEISHDEDWGGYAVAVLDPGGNVKSTHPVQVENFTYTNAMQITEFGGSVVAFKCTIVQLSKKYGAGIPLTINS